MKPIFDCIFLCLKILFLTIQIGGENGNILIWSVEKGCLLYDIQAHSGRVYDCSWSGDSRLLLSVGTDGKARLWDSAAGSELCQVRPYFSQVPLGMLHSPVCPFYSFSWLN